MKLRISKKNSENTPEEKTRGTVFRKSAAAVLVSGALMCAVFFGASQIGSLYPYAITIDDDPVCYVATKSDGDRVIKNFVKDLAVDETEVKAIDSDNRLQVVRADEMKVDSDKILSVDEACKKLSEEDALNEGKDGKDPLTLKVVSSRVDDIAFTPEPVYEANDTMLAGSEEVRSEGRNGRRRISTVYETQNGTIYGVTEKVLKVLDEGESSVIERGTLGLPDGADWKTYDGDPVYKNGEELMATAMNYIGVGYILGGDDLSEGVSCIGLVKAIYAMYGICIPMSMEGAREVGIPVSYDNMQVGDIICYTDHFALYAGNGQLLDARSGEGVGLHPLDSVGQSVLTVRRIVVN